MNEYEQEYQNNLRESSPEIIALARFFQILAFSSPAQKHRLSEFLGEFTPAPIYLSQAVALFTLIRQ